MKRLSKIFLPLFIIIATISFSKATVYIIETSDTGFAQNFDTILVGDTVKWIWINGTHTTTANSIPIGATPWNELLDNFHTSFTYTVEVPGTYNYISVPDAPLMGDHFEVVYPVGIMLTHIPAWRFSFTNPVKDRIDITFVLSETATIDISLYGMNGILIQTLFNDKVAPRNFSQTFSIAPTINPGIYFIALKVDEAILAKRVVLQ